MLFFPDKIGIIVSENVFQNAKIMQDKYKLSKKHQKTFTYNTQNTPYFSCFLSVFF